MGNSQVTHIEGAFLGASSLELFRQSWLPSGPVRGRLVVVHGYAEHSGRYAWPGRQLAEAGYAVHAYDQRGHGLSAGARVLVSSFREHLDDLAAFVTILEGEGNGTPLFLFGHSMGGAISTLYVEVRKHPFAGMILSGPAILARREMRLAAPLISLVGRIAPGLGIARLPANAVSRSPHVVEGYQRDPLVYRGKMPAGTIAAYSRALVRIDKEMPGIDIPLLLLHGTADALCSPEGSRRLYRRAASKDKTLKLYEGLAHELHNEPEKAMVIADVTAWLDSHTTA